MVEPLLDSVHVLLVNLSSLTSPNMDNSLFSLLPSLFPLTSSVPLLSLYVHVRANGQSVSPDTLAEVLDVNMFPPGRPEWGLRSLFFHQRVILHSFMLRVPLSGSFECSLMFPQFTATLPGSEMLPLISLCVISWRIVNYLVVDLECPRQPRKQ